MTERSALTDLRVLLAEDEMLVSLLIETILQDAGCVIIGPFDRIGGALEAARSKTLDLAVLDVNLAGVKVYPVAKVLTERRIPFIFLSGYGKSAVPEDHPEWRVCNKPFKPDELVTILIERVKSFRSSSNHITGSTPADKI